MTLEGKKTISNNYVVSLNYDMNYVIMYSLYIHFSITYFERSKSRPPLQQLFCRKEKFPLSAYAV